MEPRTINKDGCRYILINIYARTSLLLFGLWQILKSKENGHFYTSLFRCFFQSDTIWRSAGAWFKCVNTRIKIPRHKNQHIWTKILIHKPAHPNQNTYIQTSISEPKYRYTNQRIWTEIPIHKRAHPNQYTDTQTSTAKPKYQDIKTITSELKYRYTNQCTVRNPWDFWLFSSISGMRYFCRYIRCISLLMERSK